MNDEGASHQAEQLEALAQRLARLESLVTELLPQRSVGSMSRHDADSFETPPVAYVAPFDSNAEVTEAATARRGFLKLAGAAAAGSLVFRPTAAVAADGANLVVGSITNQSSSATRLQRGYVASGAPEPVVTFESTATGGSVENPASGDGAVGKGVGFAGVGLLGISPGYGVRGESTSGYALSAGGKGRLGFDAHTPVGPPPIDELDPPGSGKYRVYRAGDIILDGVGSLWACIVGNVSAPIIPPVWRRLSGPDTAGQLHLLPSPKRAYDSRPANPLDPAASGANGPLATGAGPRSVSLALGWDGSTNSAAVGIGATGALFNLTITQTVNAGFLSVVAGGATPSGSSTINWSTANQSIALTTIAAVSATRTIDVRCVSGGASTHFIVDVIGYFR